eukprot:COSAG01_NODE_20650_length_942_cov_382.679715_1_plen_57_part_10
MALPRLPCEGGAQLGGYALMSRSGTSTARTAQQACDKWCSLSTTTTSSLIAPFATPL